MIADLKTVAIEEVYPTLIQWAKSMGSRYGVDEAALSDAAQETMIKLHRYQQDGFPASLLNIHNPAGALLSMLRFELLRGLRNNDKYRLSTDGENTDAWMDALEHEQRDMADALDAQREKVLQTEKIREAQDRLNPYIDDILNRHFFEGGQEPRVTLPRATLPRVTLPRATLPRATLPRATPTPPPKEALSVIAGSFADKVQRVPYSKESLAEMLNISSRSLKHFIAGTKTADAETLECLDALVAEQAVQSWERIFAVLAQRGMAYEAAQAWLITALNISQRTLTRWLHGGYGATKGLNRATEKVSTYSRRP